jgi:alpha-N-arabinofuranosidase
VPVRPRTRVARRGDGALPQRASLTLDARSARRQASPTLFGLFFEDINHACDGGLNANLVNNHGFDAIYTSRRPWTPYAALLTKKPSPRVLDRTRHWSITSGTLSSASEGAAGAVRYFGRVVSDGGAVLENRGYFGSMPFRAGITFRLRLSVRADADAGPIEARLTDRRGGVLARATLDRPDPHAWTPLQANLSCDQDTDGYLQIVIPGRCTVDVDTVVLVPDDHWGAGDPRWSQGVMRRDVVEALRDLSPTFMRFPGGCIAEGAELSNAYDWKRTVLPLDERTGDYNMWSAFVPHGDYAQSNQLGFYEYFLLCEDLGMLPIPVVNAGMSCQMRSNEVVPLVGAEMDAVVQDVVDLIDWATGDPTTNEWAARRAALGHPEPFALTSGSGTRTTATSTSRGSSSSKAPSTPAGRAPRSSSAPACIPTAASSTGPGRTRARRRPTWWWTSTSTAARRGSWMPHRGTTTTRGTVRRCSSGSTPRAHPCHRCRSWCGGRTASPERSPRQRS